MSITSNNLPGTNAPSGAQMIRENLMERFAELRPAVDDLIRELGTVPDPVPESMIDEISETFLKVRSLDKRIDALREVEKSPYLEGGRAVDAFFKGLLDPLEAARKRAAQPHGVATTKRTDRIRAEEEAQRRREAEAAREAQRIADEKLAKERAEAEAALAAAEAAKQSVSPTGPEPPGEQRTGPATGGFTHAPSPASPQELQRIADRKQQDLQAAQRDADRAAAQADSAQVRHERTIEAPAAKFAKSRSHYGAVTTQVEFWDFELLDRDELDKRVIWKFISTDALLKAIKSAVESGVRELRGVRIFKARKTQVR